MVDVSDVQGQAAVADEATETTTAPAPPTSMPDDLPPADFVPTAGVLIRKKPHEMWAEEKGFLPDFFPAPATRAGVIPLGTRRNPEFWRYAAARGLNGWVIGAEVTEVDFDAAVENATTGTVMR